MLRESKALIPGRKHILARFPTLPLVAGILGVHCFWAAGEPPAVAPIPPPPESRALLPKPNPIVIMVRAVDGRLNLPLGGWGGQRLLQAKTEPEKFRSYLRAVKQRGLNCVRPLFHPPNAAKANDAEWARFDWDAMDRAVALTQEEGLYFVVDYHNWLVNDTMHAHEEEWLRTWGWLANRYKDYRHLIFEGFNEPQNQCPCLAQHYQKWINLVRSQGARQLCVVSPFWGQYFNLEDPAANWAQCRHHYFSPQNSSSAEKARAEADWHLANISNKNSAASAIRQFGCGFFMTEGGIEGRPRTESERVAEMAGVQRAIELCEQAGYGWCLWAQGDWADGFDTYGAQLKTHLHYPLITGKYYTGERGAIF
jgi:hypothetical protein